MKFFDKSLPHIPVRKNSYTLAAKVPGGTPDGPTPSVSYHKKCSEFASRCVPSISVTFNEDYDVWITTVCCYFSQSYCECAFTLEDVSFFFKIISVRAASVFVLLLLLVFCYLRAVLSRHECSQHGIYPQVKTADTMDAQPGINFVGCVFTSSLMTS